ncbi:Tfp pilus assembly protein FimT/FimU [Patescibacteria group bacterium]
MNRQAGFSLVEIVVVMSIIAIVLAFVIPNFQDGRRSEFVKAAARELAAEARYAQTLSMSQAIDEADPDSVKDLTLEIGKNNNLIRLCHYDAGLCKAEKVIQLENGVQIVDITKMTQAGVSSVAKAFINFASIKRPGENQTDFGTDAGTPHCGTESCSIIIELAYLGVEYNRTVTINSNGAILDE